MSPVLSSGLAVSLLASLHVLSPQHRGWRNQPRYWLLTLASGVAVGFVLVRLVPSLVTSAPLVHRLTGLGPLDSTRFLLTLLLAGVLLFFTGTRHVDASRGHVQELGGPPHAGPVVFAVALTGYAALNCGVGYVVVQQARIGYVSLSLLVVAKGFAFLTLDHAFLEEQGEQYAVVGRWVVAAADILGWALAVAVTLPDVVPALFLAVLGGAILVNVLKQETAPGHGSKPWPFVLGAVGYAGLAWALT